VPTFLVYNYRIVTNSRVSISRLERLKIGIESLTYGASILQILSPPQKALLLRANHQKRGLHDAEGEILRLVKI
jgi:hypothetical protein